MNRIAWSSFQFLVVLGTLFPLLHGSQAAQGVVDLAAGRVRIVASEKTWSLAEELASGISRHSGIRIPLLEDREMTEDSWKDFDLIVLGNLNDNRASARLYFEFKSFLDAAFPGENGFFVKTLVDPLGHGRTVILVGGSDQQGNRKAVEELLSFVSAHRSHWPPLHAVSSAYLPQPSEEIEVQGELPTPPEIGMGRAALDDHGFKARFATAVTPSPEDVEGILAQNRQNFQIGLGRITLNNLIGYGFHYHFTADPIWAELFRKTFLHYRELARREGDWGFDPINAVYFRPSALIHIWALIGWEPIFTDEERSRIEAGLLEIVDYVGHLSYNLPLANLPGEIRQNHSTFLGLSLEAAVRHLSRRGTDVEKWRRTAERIFEGQLRSYRSDDDAGGYAWYAPMHAFDYFQRQGSDRALRRDFLDKAADLAIISTDNRRDEVTHGDVREYTPWDLISWPKTATLLSRAAWAHGDPGHQWAYRWLSEGKLIPLADPSIQYRQGLQLYAVDMAAEPPKRLLGIASVLLDQAPLEWVASRAADPRWAPRKELRYFDKLSMRSSFEPEDEYLLLDGMAAFCHGGKDANAILRLTWHDRIWLANLDYTHRQPRHNNALEVTRDGKTAVMPPLSELSLKADLGAVGFVRSDLRDYGGLDWSRNVIWAKGSYLLILDELTARESGEYDVRAYWRTLGEAELTGLDLEVRQPGAFFRIAGADDSLRSLETVDPVLERSTQLGEWSSYPYAENKVVVLQQRKDARLLSGQALVFANLLYARPEGEGRQPVVRSLEEGLVLIEEGDTLAAVGTAGQVRRVDEVEVEAGLFWMDDERFFGAGLRRLISNLAGLTAEPAVHLALSSDSEGELIADVPTTVSLLGQARLLESDGLRRRDGLRVELEPGRHRILFPGAAASAQALARLRALARKLEPEDPAEPIDFGAEREWTVNTGARISAVEPWDGNDSSAFAVGLEDGRILRLSSAGKMVETASLKSEVRALLPLPEERLIAGDRQGEVVAFDRSGLALWRHRFGSYWGYPERIVALARQPHPSGERIIAGTEPPRVHALDWEGRHHWSTPASATPEFPTEGRRVEWWGALTEVRSVDLTGDGQSEIIVGTEYKTPIGVLDSEGRFLWILWAWEGAESRATTPFMGIRAGALEVGALDDGAAPLIVYGTETDEVYAVDSRGGEVWTSRVAGEVKALAIVDLNGDGRKEVVAATSMGYLFAFDNAGLRLWKKRHGAGLTDLSVGSPENRDGPVIAVGGADGRFYVYDAEGNLLATAKGSEPVRRLDLLDQAWGRLVTFGQGGEIKSWRLQAERPFSRSSRHHY